MATGITPFLWFDGKAEEAARFYASVFKHSKIGSIARYGDAGPAPKGSLMSVAFELAGQQFFVSNGGPHFIFSPAVSFFVSCETPEEVDELWEKLSAGGQKRQCGGLQDKYGLSWQMIPCILSAMAHDWDSGTSRVTKAMMQRTIDTKKLKEAVGADDGEAVDAR